MGSGGVEERGRVGMVRRLGLGGNKGDLKGIRKNRVDWTLGG